MRPTGTHLGAGRAPEPGEPTPRAVALGRMPSRVPPAEHADGIRTRLPSDRVGDQVAEERLATAEHVELDRV